MKKIAVLAATAALFSMVSFSAFAENISGDGSKQLSLEATKGVSYTLSIPSGTKNINLAVGAQGIGEIGLVAANFTSGSIDVTITGDFALKNGSASVAYTLDAAENKYSFAAVTNPLTKVNLSIAEAELEKATVAGTYTDTLTFTAAANNVA